MVSVTFSKNKMVEALRETQKESKASAKFYRWHFGVEMLSDKFAEWSVSEINFQV